tara:strand:- start:5216 stop:6070 length:855 start_codon:yes stop_codon:yes gene_type:complete
MNMSKLNIAAIQLNSQPNLDESLGQCYSAIESAAKSGVNLIALPENFAFLGDEIQKQQKGAEISENVLDVIPKWSKEFNVTILAGGFPVPVSNGKVYNRSIICDATGKIVASYNKIHLFDVSLTSDETYRESETVEAGDLTPTVCTLSSENLGSITQDPFNVNLGMTICYDLRFPELFRELTNLGSEIIFVPAAFTQPTGKAHWEVLLRARAIENSLFIVAPAQTGTHGSKRKTHGHAMIIDPWGNILSDAGTEPGFAMAAIDLNLISEVRQKLPSIHHRVLPG